MNYYYDFSVPLKSLDTLVLLNQIIIVIINTMFG